MCERPNRAQHTGRSQLTGPGFDGLRVTIRLDPASSYGITGTARHDDERGIWIDDDKSGRRTFVPWTSAVAISIHKERAPMTGPVHFNAAARTYTLLDDGTLDTVLTCDECGETIRTNPDYGGEPFSDSGEAFTDDELTTIRIEAATEIAEQHECGTVRQAGECPACGERVAEGELHG